jgi:hypothetical protein
MPREHTPTPGWGMVFFLDIPSYRTRPPRNFCLLVFSIQEQVTTEICRFGTLADFPVLTRRKRGPDYFRMADHPGVGESGDALGSAALQSGGPYWLLPYTQGHCDNPALLGLSEADPFCPVRCLVSNLRWKCICIMR